MSLCCEQNRTTTVEVALDHGVSLPLMRLLLNHGASVEYTAGVSLLTHAMDKYNSTTLSMIRLLFEYGYDATKKVSFSYRTY